MIYRFLEKLISKKLSDKKAIIIFGPRQSGKTSLVRKIINEFKQPVLWLNGDESDTRSDLSHQTAVKLKNLIGNNKTVVIDEAQRIENIGLCIKIIVDNIKDVKIIATGSSSFELANKINEPLTGRKWEYLLFPFSYGELAGHTSPRDERRSLEHRLVYGYYPEVITSPGEEIKLLKSLSDSYLYKDILTWEDIKKPDKLEKLVQALAHQIGNEVSYRELGQLVGLDNETVEKYIYFLEKAFVVFRLGTFSRNLRNELKKTRKIYFYDNGIRNAVINSFNSPGIRNDMGALWENFMMSERLKYLQYNQIYCNRYFWRTHAQQEIDYVEEKDGKLFAFEFKWNKKAKAKFPKSFLSAYPESETKLITPENFDEFLLNEK